MPQKYSPGTSTGEATSKTMNMGTQRRRVVEGLQAESDMTLNS